MKKPADSINFGNKCEYTSETKQTFVANNISRSEYGEPARLKNKFTKPNINFGSASPTNSDTMMTVAQANEKAMAQMLAKQPVNTMG